MIGSFPIKEELLRLYRLADHRLLKDKFSWSKFLCLYMGSKIVGHASLICSHLYSSSILDFFQEVEICLKVFQVIVFIIGFDSG